MYMNKNMSISVSVSPNETMSKCVTIWASVSMSTITSVSLIVGSKESVIMNMMVSINLNMSSSLSLNKYTNISVGTSFKMNSSERRKINVDIIAKVANIKDYEYECESELV